MVIPPTSDDQPGSGLCPGCGLLLPDVTAPTHRYIGASAACWALYCQALTNEHEMQRRSVWNPRLIVDAFTVQHPGAPGRRSVRSVGVHLVSLCFMLDHGISPKRATRLLDDVLASRTTCVWLTPPPSPGRLTVQDLLQAVERDDHEKRSWAWAAEQWSTWHAHHDQIRQWANDALR